MPNIYLSPSTQEKNLYVNGGTEEEIMNLLADAMVPYLRSSGITFTRNTPQMTAASSIAQSNAGNYDLHLALHSNAAPENLAGQLQGPDVYFYPSSVEGEKAAIIIADNLREIYPNPDKVQTRPTTSLGEVSKTKAPGILVEIAYHDNEEDASWIKNNLNAIARSLVLALTEYFGIPFISPTNPRQGVVSLRWGTLNVRALPNTNSAVIGTLENGDVVTIWGRWEDWYVVSTPTVTGYVYADYIQTY